MNNTDLSKHFMIQLHLGTGRRRATERTLHLTHLHTLYPAARAHNLLLIKYNKHRVILFELLTMIPPRNAVIMMVIKAQDQES